MTVLFLITGMTWHFSRLNFMFLFLLIYQVCEDPPGMQLSVFPPHPGLSERERGGGGEEVREI